MANYTTSSGFDDLNGSMVADGDNVSSYTSTTQGEGTVTNLGGTGLRFQVRFSAVPRPYTINASATPSGDGFSGNANNNGPENDEESWTATASTAAAAKQQA